MTFLICLDVTEGFSCLTSTSRTAIHRTTVSYRNMSGLDCCTRTLICVVCEELVVVGTDSK
jgi:hypothetical protein